MSEQKGNLHSPFSILREPQGVCHLSPRRSDPTGSSFPHSPFPRRCDDPYLYMYADETCMPWTVSKLSQVMASDMKYMKSQSPLWALGIIPIWNFEDLAFL